MQGRRCAAVDWPKMMPMMVLYIVSPDQRAPECDEWRVRVLRRSSARVIRGSNVKFAARAYFFVHCIEFGIEHSSIF